MGNPIAIEVWRYTRTKKRTSSEMRVVTCGEARNQPKAILDRVIDGADDTAIAR